MNSLQLRVFQRKPVMCTMRVCAHLIPHTDDSATEVMCGHSPQGPSLPPWRNSFIVWTPLSLSVALILCYARICASSHDARHASPNRKPLKILCLWLVVREQSGFVLWRQAG